MAQSRKRKERKQIMETITQGGNENVDVCQTFQNEFLGI
jgi:hypothetical protein